MKRYVLRLVVFSSFVGLASCDVVDPNARKTPKESYLELTVTSSAGERANESLSYPSADLASCKYIPGGGEVNWPILEVAFARGGKESANRAEHATLYFPYAERGESATESGDFSLSLNRAGAALGVVQFNSYGWGQDRTLCKVTYTTQIGRAMGTFDCPLQNSDTAEKLRVQGKFACPVQR